MAPGGRKRRLLLALGLYVVVVAAYFAVVPRYRIFEHTSYNHFSLLAESWLSGRLHLGGPPPSYAQNNDFASFGGKWFVTFPPFPAVLLVPVVWVAKTATNVRDAQIFLWLSGIGPAVLFLALEKLRRSGRSPRAEAGNLLLAAVFAFGTVYFFTALQGTVWFAAHVVGVGVGALYLLFALDAERPLLAGLMLGCGFLTRTPLLFAAPLFVIETLRVCLRDAGAPLPASSLRTRISDLWRRLDKRRAVVLLVLFAIPVVACVGVALWHNHLRFGRAGEFGYQYLTVAWAARMKKWGLFDYHFFARNLGVVLTSLPWLDPTGKVPFQINMHGLALWFTTPLYLLLLWPRYKNATVVALYLTVGAVALPGLFYQNTGWMQFGYRFSNDYAVFLFALLATTVGRIGPLFHALSAWAIVVNAFGALTFDRSNGKKFYYEEASQKIIYQPD